MKKRILISVLAFTMAWSLVACGSSYSDKGMYELPEEATASTEAFEEAAMEDYDTNGGVDSSVSVGDSSFSSSEKIISTYNYDVETKNYDEYKKALEQRISELGGYVEHSSESNSASTYLDRYCTYTIRIPQGKINQFLDVVENNATTTYRAISTENVTLTYVDLVSHINALKTEETTLLSLLEKAEKLEDILVIQDELTDVRYQIESFESQKRALENKVNYDTINLSISEVERETAVVEKPGFWAEAKNRILKSFFALVENLKAFALFLIEAIPHLIILALFVFIAKKVFDKVRAKQKKKEEERIQDIIKEKEEGKENEE